MSYKVSKVMGITPFWMPHCSNWHGGSSQYILFVAIVSIQGFFHWIWNLLCKLFIVQLSALFPVVTVIQLFIRLPPNLKYWAEIFERNPAFVLCLFFFDNFNLVSFIAYRLGNNPIKVLCSEIASRSDKMNLYWVSWRHCWSLNEIYARVLQHKMNICLYN